jgi:acylphosphatase
MARRFELAVHVLIDGRVQRVGYRAWTEGQAQARRLGGWVRNRTSGAVEAIFAGPAVDVAAMLEACQRGPLNARVDRIEKRDASEDELAHVVPGRFEVRETA